MFVNWPARRKERQTHWFKAMQVPYEGKNRCVRTTKNYKSEKWPLYELIHDISVRPQWNNLWCTNYSSVRTNTRFTVIFDMATPSSTTSRVTEHFVLSGEYLLLCQDSQHYTLDGIETHLSSFLPMLQRWKVFGEELCLCRSWWPWIEDCHLQTTWLEKTL